VENARDTFGLAFSSFGFSFGFAFRR